MRCAIAFAFAFALVLALTWAPVRAEDERENKRVGQEKLEWLLNRSEQRPLISLGSGDFEKLVGSGPRPYDLIVFLTSKGGGCQLCSELRPELELVANAYEAARYDKESSDPKHKVFFVELDGSRNYELFQQLGFQTVPHVVFLPPTSTSKKRSWQKLLSDRLNFNRGWGADAILKSVGQRTKLNVPFTRPPTPIDWSFYFLLLSSVAVFVTFFSTVGRPYVDSVLRNRNVYFFFVMAAYFFCTSGGMYVKITGMPVSGDEKEGFIHPSSGSQYGAEGYVIAFLNLVLAVAVILMNTRVKGDLKSQWSRNTVLAAGCFCFFIFFRQLRDIYTRKNPGYRWGWVWD